MKKIIMSAMIGIMALNMKENLSNSVCTNEISLDGIIAVSDSLTEKEKVYNDMQLRGWQFNGYWVKNVPQNFIDSINGDIYEYKLTEKAWTYPTRPDIPGAEMPGYQTLWRRLKGNSPYKII